MTRNDNGARFVRVDLHVHTPASSDWRGDGDAAAADVAQSAIDAGLAAIAITDHNTAAWCEAVANAADGTELAVFPGCEISTPEGHLLAIFDVGTQQSAVEDLLVRLGFDRDQFGNLEAISEHPLNEVAQEVKRAGAIAIPAHVEADKGFWKQLDGNGPRRKALYACDHFAALEIVSPALREDFNKGTKVDYSRKWACLQGSDSYDPESSGHAIPGIGRRHSILKVSEPSLRAIQHALLDFNMRVRLPSDDITHPKYVIRSLHVSGGFFDDVNISFNPGLNCLIGGTGSGKSLAIELLRLLLDQQADADNFPAIAEEVEGRLDFALRGSCTIRGEFSAEGRDYVIERAWENDEVADVAITDVTDDPHEPLQAPVPLEQVFPVRAFSQSEVIEYARQPMARLSLIDALVDIDDLRPRIDDLANALELNAGRLIELEEKAKRHRDQISDAEGLRAAVERLKGFFNQDAVKEHEAWETEHSFITSIEGTLDTLLNMTKGWAIALEEEVVLPNRPEQIVSLEETIGGFEQLLRDAISQLKDAVQQATDSLIDVQGDVKELRTRWASGYEEHENEYRELIVDVQESESGQASLLAKLERLQGRLRALEAKETELTSQIEPQIKRVAGERDNILDELTTLQQERRTRRETKAEELTGKMGGVVRIRIERYVQHSRFREALGDLARGSRIRHDALDDISHACHPIPLVKSLRNGEFSRPSDVSGVDESVFEDLTNWVDESNSWEELLALQAVEVEDGVAIQFALEEDEYRGIEALAHGQKCTAVLMIALAEGEGPLIVDQPEDALHAPWIEKYLVPRLRQDRGRRQCIFATRSPNMVVSADAEQIIALGASANSGEVEKLGSLEEYDTNDLVLYHVEGGRPEFTRRTEKYMLE